MQQSPVQVLIATRDRPTLGLDPGGSLRRGARDRAEPARDERGRGRGDARRRARWNQLRPPRPRGRLAGRDRPRQPDDDRGSVAGGWPRASRAALRVLRRRGLPRRSSRTAGSGSACSRRLRASIESSPPSSRRGRASRVLRRGAGARGARGAREAGSSFILSLRRSWKSKREGRRTGDTEQSIARCLVVIGDGLEWDAAFDLVDRFGTADDFDTLFTDALDELLNAARLATVETWIGRRRPSSFRRRPRGCEGRAGPSRGKHLSARDVRAGRAYARRRERA